MAVEQRFNVPINLTGNELRNALMQVLSSAPTATLGRFYYDSTDNVATYWDGARWVPLDVRKETNIPSGALEATGVTAHRYGDSTHVGRFTVNAQGQLIAASETVIAFPVDQVNGQTGNVSLNAGDVGAIATSARGAAGGVASLDSSGQVPSSQIPAIAISNTFVVASQSAQTSLTAEVGDVCIRTDQHKSYILKDAPASTFANWELLQSPTAAVSSVFGRTGAITAETGDYTFAQIASTPTTLSGYGITNAYTKSQVDAKVASAGDLHKYSKTIGDGSATAFTLTHNLGTQDVQVSLRNVASGALEYAAFAATGSNTVKVSFARAPGASSYVATVIS